MLGSAGGLLVEWLNKAASVESEVAKTVLLIVLEVMNTELVSGVFVVFWGCVVVVRPWCSHTVSEVALPSRTTALPWHLWRHKTWSNQKATFLRASYIIWASCTHFVWGWQLSVSENVAENIPLRHDRHFTFESAVPENNTQTFDFVHETFDINY